LHTASRAGFVFDLLRLFFGCKDGDNTFLQNVVKYQKTEFFIAIATVGGSHFTEYYPLPEYFENITVNCSSEIVSKFG
jgi:hypothetical protein